MAREKEKVKSQGIFDRHRTFMAFKRAEASSALWPPERKATPGTAPGTVLKQAAHRGIRHLL